MSEVSMDADPTDDDLRWLGFTEMEIVILGLYSPQVRRTVYELRLEELMQ